MRARALTVLLALSGAALPGCVSDLNLGSQRDTDSDAGMPDAAREDAGPLPDAEPGEGGAPDDTECDGQGDTECECECDGTDPACDAGACQGSEEP